MTQHWHQRGGAVGLVEVLQLCVYVFWRRASFIRINRILSSVTNFVIPDFVAEMLMCSCIMLTDCLSLGTVAFVLLVHLDWTQMMAVILTTCIVYLSYVHCRTVLIIRDWGPSPFKHTQTDPYYFLTQGLFQHVTMSASEINISVVIYQWMYSVSEVWIQVTTVTWQFL